VTGLTSAGRAAFKLLDDRSAEQVRALLSARSEPVQQRLTSAMTCIRQILGDPHGPAWAPVLREPGPGDLGWIVQAHGALYAAEYGWDVSFEALVAQIVADYAAGHDPAAERAWIAEVAGQPAGCVLCVRKDESTAQLRLLLVDPAARGLGIGSKLVAECVTFARAAGYGRLVLWTNDVLTAARRVYQRAGFQLAGSQPHQSFGHDLVGQDWRLDLR
jgi:GNAT superfamily N-acetyltransferase